MYKTDSELLITGMNLLTKGMGVIEAERFIAMIIHEKSDYTKWQREYFDAKTPEELMSEAIEHEKTHPFQGKAERI